MKEKSSLLRIIRTPEGEIIQDYSGKANGRGAYICKDKACLAKCVKSKALQRHLKTEIPKEIIEQIENTLQG